jgi:hypothetical protein
MSALGTIRFVMLVVPIICSPSLAMADRAFVTCRAYFGSESDLPQPVSEMLPLAAGGGVRVCTSQTGPQLVAYDVLSRVTKGQLGVCRYTAHRVFQQTDGGPTWTLTPPQDKDYLGWARMSMAVSAGECPQQDDPAYIAVSNVSEGMFLEIVRFWQRISSDHAAFDAAFAHFPAWARSSDVYRGLEAAVKGRDHALRFGAVRLANKDSHRGAVAYDMDLIGENEGWSLFVDIVDGHLKALDLGSVIY